MILEEEQLLRPEGLPFPVTDQAAGVTSFERAASPDSSPAPQNGRHIPALSIPEGGTSLEEIEREMVTLALRQAQGNQTHAARLLDISRDALRYKMKKFNLLSGEEQEPPENAA